MLHEHSLCALNGDLLAPGSSFSLHHGDRLLLGPERLFLVSLWKGPLHDGSYHHQGVRAPAADNTNSPFTAPSDALTRRARVPREFLEPGSCRLAIVSPRSTRGLAIELEA